ncbi:MAG: hypothetical protein U9Q38_08395 [Thermodesulfobacteriota bacterium]|nr:hypothetical protein [Thermodesulfobacteriota bacterium]
MKQGGGKRKGSGFERDVAKILTKWLTGKERPYAFYRQPASGGIFTIFEECGDMSGDIRAMLPVAIPIMRRFSIECKNGYPHANFHQHLKKSKGFQIEKFWEQCTTDATNSSKYPMLIFKKQGLNIILGIDCKLRIMLKEQVKLPKSITLSFNNLTSVTFYDMIEFLDVVTPEIIEELPWQN